MTYVALANITLGSSASTITFSSIPTTGFRDLVLVSTPVRTANANTRLRVNSDTGSNYSQVRMYGDSAGAGSDANTLDYFDLGTSSSSGYNSISQIMDYSATDKHKAFLIRQNLPSAYTLALAGRWANTAAINSVQVYTVSDTFLAGSTFALYGIRS